MRHVREYGPWRSALLGAALCATLLGSAAPAEAGENRWTPFGGGGTLADLAFAPGRIYAAVHTREGVPGEVYRSEDGGQSWIWASRGLPFGQIASLALLPGPTPVVLAAVLRVTGSSDLAPPVTTVRVMASADEGRSWRQILVHQGPTHPPYHFSFTQASLTAVPHIPAGTDLYLTAGPQLFRSADGGATWHVVLERETFFGKVTANPADPRELYVGAFSPPAGGRVLRSLDRGSSWTDLPPVEPEIAPDTVPLVFAVAPGDPPALFAGVNQAAYKSTDRGATWRRLDLFALVEEMAVDPGDPSRLSAVLSEPIALHNLYTSTDAGESWARDDTSPGQVARLRVDAATRTAYALRPPPLPAFRRAPGGEWTSVPERGLLVEQLPTYERGAHPSVYLRGDGRVSADGGRTWLPASTSRFDPYRLVLDPHDPRLRYAFGPDGIYRSTDGGEHWRLRSRTWTGCAPGGRCQLAFVARDELLAGASCGLSRSTDGGQTWRETLSCRSALSLEPLRIHPDAPRTIYAHAHAPDSEAGPGGRSVQRLFRSTDGGATWRQTFEGSGTLALAPGNPHIVYLSRPQALYRSTNGGRTFARTGEPACRSAFCLNALEVDPHDPDRLYAATADGVLRSRDAGWSWQALNAGLPEVERTNVERLVVHPRVPGLLYAYPLSGGTFEARFP